MILEIVWKKPMTAQNLLRVRLRDVEAEPPLEYEFDGVPPYEDDMEIIAWCIQELECRESENPE